MMVVQIMLTPLSCALWLVVIVLTVFNVFKVHDDKKNEVLAWVSAILAALAITLSR